MAGEEKGVKTLNCLSCSAPLQLRGLGQTSTLACQHCGAIIDISKDEFALVQASQKITDTPCIPLGSRGTINDTVFEIIGFMVRTDSSGAFEWREYLLFNPYKGFRWLVESNGHWSFVQPLVDLPVASYEYVIYGGKSFRKFLVGSALVKFVMGEFYWEVRAGDSVGVADYIAPPEIISSEQDGNETVWSLGEYVEPDTIEKTFPDNTGLPWRHGVAANQPAGGGNSKMLAAYGIFFIAALFVLQIVFTISAQGKVVHTQSSSHPRATSTMSQVSPTFTLSGGTTNVRLDLSAAVDNAWFSVDGELISATSEDEQIPFSVEVGYYHGYEDGESWVEGSQSAYIFLPAVPPGSYKMTFDTEKAPIVTVDVPFTISVTRDVPYWGNFFLAFCLIGIYPAIGLGRRAYFEAQRWQESDLGYGDE